MNITWEQITKWVQLSILLKTQKTQEAKQRREICEDIFEGRTGKFTEKKYMDVVPEGETETLHLEIVAKSTTSFKVDEAELQILKDQGLLTETDEACFERKLSIKDGELRKLSKDSVVWQAITEKPGMPTLDVRKIEK